MCMLFCSLLTFSLKAMIGKSEKIQFKNREIMTTAIECLPFLAEITHLNMF